jgi:hypothetical protein
MSFKFQRHSPKWYREKNHDENFFGPIRGAFKRDLKWLDVANAGANDSELLELYEEEWNKIMAGERGNANIGELQKILEKEGRFGRPQDDYVKGPFLSIARIMEKNGLVAEDVRLFLTWRSKNENMAKARAGIRKKETKKEKAVRDKLEKAKLILGRKTWVPSNSDF